MSQAFMDCCATVVEGSGFAVAARLRLLSSGAYIKQADFGTIVRKVFKAGVQVGSDTSVVVTTAVFDTLQTGNPLWVLDTTGYNFYDVVDDTVLPDGDTMYDLWYEFEMTGQPLFRFNKSIYTRDVPGE